MSFMTHSLFTNYILSKFLVTLFVKLHPMSRKITNYPKVSLWRPMVRSMSTDLEITAIDAQCKVHLKDPVSEEVMEPYKGSTTRTLLNKELTRLCRKAPVVQVLIGSELVQGEKMYQEMPFEHARRAAKYYNATLDLVQQAIDTAIKARAGWEWTDVHVRCKVFEAAAALMAGPHRQRIIAAAMVGQAMNAIQAELNVCQLIDYTRFNSKFLRDLTLSRCVIDGGSKARNINHYYGLEGFFAAITPSDSLSNAAQLALTPALMGNGVVWKPSENAILACHRVLKCFIQAGLPPGVVNFVPCEKEAFLNAVAGRPELAGIAFGGNTQTLEMIYRRIGENIDKYNRFPRIAGTGSGKNFHVVHSSADQECALANTVRAAFEMAGQKTTSCSRLYVEKSIMSQFLERLVGATQKIYVTSPLDYRCFTSAMVSKEAYERVSDILTENLVCHDAKLLTGGRTANAVGYYVEPTIYQVNSEDHPLLTQPVRGPVLAVLGFRSLEQLSSAVAKAPYAVSGAIFAKNADWTRQAVSVLRDNATMMTVNERCSEELPAHQSLGGSRKSGPGSKAGSISYLLSFCSECSLRESKEPNRQLLYNYMLSKPAS